MKAKIEEENEEESERRKKMIMKAMKWRAKGVESERNNGESVSKEMMISVISNEENKYQYESEEERKCRRKA